jgi:hypothetical protein
MLRRSDQAGENTAENQPLFRPQLDIDQLWRN